MFRPTVAISASLALALLAAILIWRGLHPLDGKVGKATAPAQLSGVQTVVVASADIMPGQVLTADDVSLISDSTAQKPASVLHQIADVQNHMALAAVRAGSPLLRSAVSATPVQGLAPHIPVGYRAYAIAVNETQTAGGFLQVGDHVDLYVTLPGALFGEKTVVGRKVDDQSKSTVLLQGVTVLAVGAKLQTNGTSDTTARTVTLALNTDALSKIALAARLGTISFAIRNPIDRDKAPAQLATIGTLVGANDHPPLTSSHIAMTSATRGVVLYMGKERSVVRTP